MKSRQSFLKVIVILCLLLLLFSTLGIAVLYIGQNSQQQTLSQNQSGINLNEMIKAELSGNSLIIDEAGMKQQENSGEAVVLPKEN